VHDVAPVGNYVIAIVALAALWFVLPPGAHWPLALLLVGGALVADKAFAEARGLPGPLEAFGL
jgi:hypothetical protein